MSKTEKMPTGHDGPPYIRVRGARVHNLKNVHVDIPRNQFVVITGLSGSGKSSLAFDTLYAEGQRRYVESLSAYARQFLDQMDKPEVDTIEGLSPAISIEQRHSARTPRSTVGTVTEIYDYLRVFFARVGKPHCPECGDPISSQTIDQMVDKVMALDAQTKVTINAPIVQARKGEYQSLFRKLRKEGFARVLVDGEVLLLEDEIQLDRKKKHDIDLVVDRLVIREGIESRVSESIETALRYAEGLVRVVPFDADAFLMSERNACTSCGISLPDLEPRSFSFNAPQGACTRCNGLGSLKIFDPNLVIPDSDLPLIDGAIAPWKTRKGYAEQILRAVADHLNIALSSSFSDLPNDIQSFILYGPEDEELLIDMQLSSQDGRNTYNFKKAFKGVIPMLQERYKDTESQRYREQLEDFMSEQECPSCHGARLRKEVLAVKIDTRNIAEITSDTVDQVLQWISGLELGQRDQSVSERLMVELVERLRFLTDVGLGYLTLDRRASTLSGGEEQRIRLATQLGNALTGVLYILDEPSIGLHPADHDRLLVTLKRLRDRGNSVLVVEHDEETIRAADWVIDLGPGAGRHGGEVVAADIPDQLHTHERSLTGAYLAGKKQVPMPAARRQADGWILVQGARTNNLKNVDVKFPRKCLTVVSGVSGSGKSSLVIDTLYTAASNQINRTKLREAEHDEVGGLGDYLKVIDIDQTPIGRTPRSNPATYVDLFTPIRQLFAATPDAKLRGFTPGRFSFNVKGGRCEACEGAGLSRIEMHFLPDVFVVCEVCKGTRYNRETLDIRYKNKNISEVLSLTIEEAAEFFSAVPSLNRKLALLEEVGLGYLQLGQSATTLSGGEAQRIKLAKELTKKSRGQTLYILDEPTTGLHIEDVRKLLEVLQRLVDADNTVIVIEHHLDLIKASDWLVEVGPQGGEAGGQITATGTPEAVAADETSVTGQYLRPLLVQK